MSGIAPALTDEAVDLMKRGAAPAAVYERLVASGVSDPDARGLVDRLVALKRQAEARDPERLRNEAIWMFWHGAASEQVVAHFVAAGVAEEHARPEVDRIFARVQTLRPCDRCRRPMKPEEAFFDGVGRKVCRSCHSMDEIGNAERRVMDNALEAIGVPAFALQAASAPYMNGQPRGPVFCPRCGGGTGVHVSVLPPQARASVHPSVAFVCSRCWASIA